MDALAEGANDQKPIRAGVMAFEWFQNTDRQKVVSKKRWDEIYGVLNRLWQEERADTKPGELAAHAGATGRKLIQ